MKRNHIFIVLILIIFSGCQTETKESSETQTVQEPPFLWENANIYFLLTDRFNNGDPSNDLNFERTNETGKLRGFEGGDIVGITQKIKSGYFEKLGINTIWFTPVVEQIKGSVDEGTGETYAYHGYWARDWTSLDPNFGTEEELAELVQEAHKRGIRVLLDVVINHTGPVTEKDDVYPEGWVRTSPQCTYQNYVSTVTCTLVENLPDIKTESDEAVELPQFLKDKWEKEGRLEKEMAELDAFFNETGYPRAPRFYIIKWLVDLIKKYGVDGFRVDTVKHTEESVWAELDKEAVKAFEDWKRRNPEKVLDDNEFFMMGEVYNYNLSNAEKFYFGDSVVNFFDYGFNSLINFEFKYDATKDYEEIFSKYSTYLNDSIPGKTVLNYISSHDDGSPFDKERERTYESATKLLLCPGGSQIYYGDESGRSLIIEGTIGDATLRSNMNWEAIESDEETQKLLTHWQKLGSFRNQHPAIGAGRHKMISEVPYVFQRTLSRDNFEDRVLVALELESGENTIQVAGVFEDGSKVKDAYTGNEYTVNDGIIELNTTSRIALIESIK